MTHARWQLVAVLAILAYLAAAFLAPPRYTRIVDGAVYVDRLTGKVCTLKTAQRRFVCQSPLNFSP